MKQMNGFAALDDDWDEEDLDEFSDDVANLCIDDICRNNGRCVWECWK